MIYFVLFGILEGEGCFSLSWSAFVLQNMLELRTASEYVKISYIYIYVSGVLFLTMA